ncbi:hypothetical protein K461DRAFT_280322 [Myriangium duriaei CBS 260.36]|uniref:Uncharacterized protein n=1 Tax=Myriangium duriaei CBS 260.36 TaxID=1168546 RepID=A0A9P4MHS0_9PEZI|nr:hypothetical protein K461DRAFT_280322 [Myriangium duriaei CBS 260.36]
MKFLSSALFLALYLAATTAQPLNSRIVGSSHVPDPVGDPSHDLARAAAINLDHSIPDDNKHKNQRSVANHEARSSQDKEDPYMNTLMQLQDLLLKAASNPELAQRIQKIMLVVMELELKDITASQTTKRTTYNQDEENAQKSSQSDQDPYMDSLQQLQKLLLKAAPNPKLAQRIQKLMLIVMELKLKDTIASRPPKPERSRREEDYMTKLVRLQAELQAMSIKNPQDTTAIASKQQEMLDAMSAEQDRINAGGETQPISQPTLDNQTQHGS